MRWRKSSYSGDTGNCVEVSSDHRKRVAVRDSKNPSGVVLIFDRTEWARFLTDIRAPTMEASLACSPMSGSGERLV
ncbi:DUF397 domain-containing protein [Thermopolyspora sp. NPDC052614]|uniref:DUF397 domain-containing protein n=1 Tax=Thermopolyspora sp. NPDC052614 TaxID=3155682 RepID=UPI00343B15C4